MRRAVASLPSQFAVGAAAAASSALPVWPTIREVVHCGMGGSAFPADLVRLAVAPLGVRLFISRAYEVECPGVAPGQALGASTLTIISSFSGNTEETLASYDDARARGATMVALAHGGELAARAIRDGVPLVRLPKPDPEFQPRAATGYFVGALAGVLQHAGLWPNAVAELGAVEAHLEQRIGELEPRVPTLVEALRGKIPVIYGTGGFALAVAQIAKIKFNENAKTPAFWNRVPEFNHNEMVGYTQVPGPICLVFVDDPRASKRVQRRLHTSIQTLRGHGLPVIELALAAEGPDLGRAFELLYLFDLVTIALAVDAGLDPNPVAMVETFKAALQHGPAD